MRNSPLANQNRTISGLEHYMKNGPGKSVLILDQFDFVFSKDELRTIKELWLEGIDLPEIAKQIKRDKNETFLALFHLSFANRKNGKNNIYIKISQLRG